MHNSIFKQMQYVYRIICLGRYWVSVNDLLEVQEHKDQSKLQTLFHVFLFIALVLHSLTPTFLIFFSTSSIHHGSVKDIKRSDRPSNANDLKLDFLLTFKQESHSSIRETEYTLDIVWKILHNNKCQPLQKLIEDDFDRILQFMFSEFHLYSTHG